MGMDGYIGFYGVQGSFEMAVFVLFLLEEFSGLGSVFGNIIRIGIHRLIDSELVFSRIVDLVKCINYKDDLEN